MIKPYFSMALNRAREEPGALAFGGLPGGSFRHTGNFARAPLQQLVMKTEVSPPPMVEDGLRDYRVYVIDISLAVNSQPSAPPNVPLRVIIDSGSRLCHLPKSIVRAIAKAWQPAATEYRITKQWMVDCAGTPPKVEFLFNGSTIFMDGKDLWQEAFASAQFRIFRIAIRLKGHCWEHLFCEV